MIPGLTTLQVAGIGLAAVLLVGGVQQVRVALAQADAKTQTALASAQAARAVNLAVEVTEARGAVAEAARINARNVAALEEMNRANAALRAQAATQEREAAARLEAAARAATARRAADAVRRARTDAPPAAEMTAALRDAIGGAR